MSPSLNLLFPADCSHWLTHPIPYFSHILPPKTDSDLAIAIVEVCGDPATQIECLDDTPGCHHINTLDPDDIDEQGLAFTTDPVSMVGGQTCSVYLGT